MPAFGLAIDAFKTRPFSTCITTLTDCDVVFTSATSVVLFLDADGTRTGFAAGSGCGATVICAGCEAAVTTAVGTSVLNPFVTAITVDKPTPIKTAATRNTERCWTSDDD